MDVNTYVVEPVRNLWAQLLTFLPSLISVLLLLLLGWLVATMIQKVATRFLKLARLDSLSEKVGVANILTKGDINYTLSEIIGVLIYWLIMLVVAILVVNFMHLEVAAELLNRVVLYIPNVIAAVFVLVLGIFFASILANTVRTAAANAGLQQARTLGQITQVTVAVFVFLQAVKQLGIDTTLVDMILRAIVYSLAFGFGLAIGLGCKDMAGRYVQQLVDSFKPKR